MEHAWEQQPKESNLWFDRFNRYRLAGVKRAYLPIYNAERLREGKKKAASLPKSWHSAIASYDWVERAQAWDVHQRQLEEQQFEQERQDARAARHKTTQALMAILGRVIINEQEVAKALTENIQGAKAAKMAGMSAKVLKDLAQAAATIMKESRIEFGEATDIQQVQGSGEHGEIEISHKNVLGLKDLFQHIGQREKHVTSGN